jgi:hypothetical protein
MLTYRANSRAICGIFVVLALVLGAQGFKGTRGTQVYENVSTGSVGGLECIRAQTGCVTIVIFVAVISLDLVVAQHRLNTFSNRLCLSLKRQKVSDTIKESKTGEAFVLTWHVVESGSSGDSGV